MKFILARLQEKSTWTAIIGLALALTGHAVLDPDTAVLVDKIAGLIVGGVLAVSVTKPDANAVKLLLIGLLGFGALPLGGCVWSLSNGDQVVLTPQNAVPLVVDQIKQVCASYDANKVAYDALTAVATRAINNSTATGAVQTAQQIATAACPLLDAMIQSPAKPAAPGG